MTAKFVRPVYIINIVKIGYLHVKLHFVISFLSCTDAVTKESANTSASADTDFIFHTIIGISIPSAIVIVIVIACHKWKMSKKAKSDGRH